MTSRADIVWKKSAKRRRVYDEQLSKFKVVYTRWKSETYITYLNVNFDVPKHLNPILRRKVMKRKRDQRDRIEGNCCWSCGAYLNDGRDRYCPVCGCPNDNYMPPLRNVKPPKSKEQEDKEWNRCCMLMFVVFLILCILGKAMQ